jgi:two-component system response regulator NreC
MSSPAAPGHLRAEAHRDKSGARTVVIADDHRLVREGLRALIDADPSFRVVAEAGDTDTTIVEVTERCPDLLTLDLHMPGSATITAISELRRLSPGTSIVIVTMAHDPEYARQALRAGVAGYVLKDAPWSEVLHALRGTATGRAYIDPEIGAHLASSESPAMYEELTSRECEVLRLLALGHTNREIARLLFISVRTAESHRASIRAKLDTSSRSELVDYAREQRLID